MYKRMAWNQHEPLSTAKMQSMLENDKTLYDDIIKNPLGVLAYKQYTEYLSMGPAAPDMAHPETPTPWLDVAGMECTVNVMADRLLKIEFYISTFARNVAAGNQIFHGFRVIRDGGVLMGGAMGGNYYWYVNDFNERYTVYQTIYDAPKSGVYQYGLQWRNGNTERVAIEAQPTGETEVGNDLGVGTNAIGGNGPAYFIVEDMGSAASLPVESISAVDDDSPARRDMLTSRRPDDMIYNMRHGMWKRFFNRDKN